MSGLRRIPTIEIDIQRYNNKKNDEHLEEVNIVGPLCSPLDYLAKNVKIPKLSIGDIVCVPSVGAYGLSASLIAF